jgi:hypothetical protein
MGMFSSKKVISVSANTMNLVDVSPKPFTDAILIATIDGKDLISALMKTMVNNVAANMPRIYKYARDQYTLGLPQGKALDYGNINLDAIDTILLSELGNTPLYRATGAVYVDITPAIAVYPHLINTRLYNRNSNEIAAYPPGLIWQQPVGPGNLNVAAANKKVYLDSATEGADGLSIDITYSLYLERPVVVGYDDYNYASIIELQFIREPYVYIENVPLLDVPNITWGENYIVATYREYDETGLIPTGPEMPWLYRISSLIYPQLDPANTAIAGLDYFPVIPLRYENADLTAEIYQETDLYKTSKELARIAQVGIDDLAIKLNESPDVGAIDHAYVMYGVNIRTEVPESLHYLHKFFESLYDLQSSNELAYLTKIGTLGYYGTAAVNTFSTSVPNNTGTFTEHGLQLFLDYDYVKSLTSVGIVGDGRVGKITKTFIEYQEQILVGYDYDEYGGSTPKYIINTKGAMILTLQASINIIHKIEVYGLELRNLIYKGRSEHTSMLDVIRNENENNLVIPLQYQLAQSFPLKLRNPIYADALLIVLNSYQVTKLKWYQSSWFKIIIIIVAIVLTVLAIISGQAWLAKIIADGVLALLVAVAVAALINIAITLAARFIVDQYGDKLGVVGAVIMVIVAVVIYFFAPSASREFMMASAQMLLQGASALVSATNEFLIEAAQEILSEYEAFTSLYNEAKKELEVSADLLKNKVDLNPLMFARPERLRIVPNETPDGFYKRCLELPSNTMHVIHEEIPNFFTARLTLSRSLPIEMYA